MFDYLSASHRGAGVATILAATPIGQNNNEIYDNSKDVIAKEIFGHRGTLGL